MTMILNANFIALEIIGLLLIVLITYLENKVTGQERLSPTTCIAYGTVLLGIIFVNRQRSFALSMLVIGITLSLVNLVIIFYKNRKLRQQYNVSDSQYQNHANNQAGMRKVNQE